MKTPEFFSISVCLSALKRVNKPTPRGIQIKEIILYGYLLNEHTSEEYIKMRDSQIYDQIMSQTHGYEQKWLVSLLDSATIEKELNRWNYQANTDVALMNYRAA